MKNTITVGLVALLLGLGGGVLGTYSWMRDVAPGGAERHDEEGEHAEHGDEGEHAGHDDDEHGGHEEHEEGVVHLNAAQLSGLTLTHVEVRRGSLAAMVELSGEVAWNADRLAHIVPRVSGQVREVHGRLGDEVHAGDVLAVIDSRELAEAKAGDLAAEAKLSLMRISLERVENLFEKKIAPEEELLKAKLQLAEAEIEHRTAEAKLHALGLTEAQVQELHEEKNVDYSRYEIKAPFGGVVVEKHLTLGEVVGPESDVFLLADLSDVWVMGRAYERDIRLLKAGQEATIRLDAFPGQLFAGEIDYIASQLDPGTRTVEARVVLPNADGQLRPGMFGTVVIHVGHETDAAQREGMLVPAAALQRVKDGFVVFQATGPGEYKLVPVLVIGKTREFAEVTGAISIGDKVAIGDTFVLKSEAGKAEMGGGHSH